MTPVKVAHAVYSWLPVTQNWIYTQLRCNRQVEHAVLSMTEECTGQFPLGARYTAFQKTPCGRAGLLMARYWIRQPDAFYRTVLRKVNPNLIHGHFSTESWRILAHARTLGIPLVTTFYGLDVEKLPRRRFWKKRYPLLFAYGACFLVEGPFMGKRLEAIGCPTEKIRIVALGVDHSLYRHNKRAETGREKETVKVLFAGLEREKKGPLDAAAVFIAAVRVDPRLELHLIGNGPYRKPVERMLRAAGVRHRAVFHGYLLFERYREVLAGCDILLAPSRYAADGDCEGGAPVVCIEAQVAGMPVVGTRHCDIPFVVKHGSTGFLSEEGNTVSMCRDLLMLARDSNLRQSMGARGREHAALRHDIYTQVENIARIYGEVLDDGAGGVDRG